MINQHWVFGRECGLDFSESMSASTSTSSHPNFNTHAGSASISDTNGQLIMYTDGVRVWDSAGTLRATPSFGSIYSNQSPLIIPDPSNATRYYVLTSSGYCGHLGDDHHLDGILIDSNTWLSTPLSSLMVTPQPPTDGYAPTGKLTAIRHANCDDFWIITIIQEGAYNVAYAPGILRVFLINSEGIHYVADTPLNVAINNTGYLKGSRDGSRIAIANPDKPEAIPGNQNVLVLPFDNQTGQIDVASMLTIPVPPVSLTSAHRRWPYGIEFSPNSHILYYSVLGFYVDNSANLGNLDSYNGFNGYEGYIFQHDLLNPLTPSLEIGVHPNNPLNPDNPENTWIYYAIGALQLGDDNQIYIAQDTEQHLGVIADPNMLGLGCNLTFSALSLPTNAWCRLDLPNLIPVHKCSCEKVNQNWVFGKGARLDFSTSIPTPLSSNISAREGCASISDTNGNLIMYTNGLSIWDGTDAMRVTGLQGGILSTHSTQSVVIVPNPGSVSQYYVFTTSGAASGNHHLSGILIDISTSIWSSTQLSIPVATGYSPTEKLTVIQHANGRDFWVITIIQTIVAGATASGIGLLRMFLIDPNGFHPYSNISLNAEIHDKGYMKGSRDGKRIAVANWENENVLVIPFNNLDGTIDLSILLDIHAPLFFESPVYGVEFSPNSNILYYTVSNGEGNGYVFQCDLLSNGSWVQVGSPYPCESVYGLGALQLGIDDRIYIAQYGKNYLGIIENPNILGSGCTLTFDSISLNYGACLMGLPNLIPNLCESAS